MFFVNIKKIFVQILQIYVLNQDSYCVPNGPNHFLCLCKNGYYGYKCLRYGKFPAGKFFGISIAITVTFKWLFLFNTSKKC